MRQFDAIPEISLAGHPRTLGAAQFNRAYNAWLRRRGLEDREPTIARIMRKTRKRQAELRVKAREEYLSEMAEYLED